MGVILNTGSVSLFSRWNLENSIGERISGYLLASYPYFVGYRRGAVAYFNKSVERNTNLTNRLLRGFRRCNGNDLETAQNALFCVTVLSNNPYSIQIYENSLKWQNSLSYQIFNHRFYSLFPPPKKKIVPFSTLK